jgi:C-3',4' desaturase CrtD
MKKVVIIGAGFGGLASAVELARQGFEVTVLEAHVYPGGCAGTFYHQGYRFDAGATLAGGFAPGAPMHMLGQHFGIDWEARPAQRAMLVHLPDGSAITRWTNPDHWRDERQQHFGSQAESFWEWQEATADMLWDFALRLPAWPPHSSNQLFSLARIGVRWFRDWAGNGSLADLSKLPYQAFKPLKVSLNGASERLRLFADSQLLISAQTTSAQANALYGAVALDLPRQGVSSIPGGMGGMAEKLVESVRQYGGQVLFRQEATQVQYNPGYPIQVTTKRKDVFQADSLIFNLPPWNIASLLGDSAPPRLQYLPPLPEDGWGAFMVYLGVNDALIPADFPLHHQVILREPLGEGNSIFLSISPDWDRTRAPQGKRAITISTHTDLGPWWSRYSQDRQAYQKRKDEYLERVLQGAKRILPKLRAAADLILPGTPLAFQRFTRRYRGWVGGFPQTSLWRNWNPHLAPNLWMVGDTIFPGQSVPAVSLGGLRVARAVLEQEKML